MDDLRAADVDFLTIGQYLQPTRKHHEVVRFVHARRIQGLRDHRLCQGLPDGVGLAADALLASCRRGFRAAEGRARRAARVDMRRVLVIGLRRFGQVDAFDASRRKLAPAVRSLDRIFWDPGWVRARKREDFTARMTLGGHEAAVGDGRQFRQPRPASARARADSIIWLDYPRVCMLGVIPPHCDELRPHASRICRGMSGTIRFGLYRFVWTFRTVHRPKISPLSTLRGHWLCLPTRKQAAEFSRAQGLPDAAIPHQAARPHSASEMFDLVADVERYPEFVPLCEPMRVRKRTTEGRGRGSRPRRRHDGRLQAHARDLHQPRHAGSAEPADPGRISRRPVQPDRQPLDFHPGRRAALRRRVLHFLRVQEPRARDADGRDVRGGVPPLSPRPSSAAPTRSMGGSVRLDVTCGTSICHGETCRPMR